MTSHRGVTAVKSSAASLSTKGAPPPKISGRTKSRTPAMARGTSGRHKKARCFPYQSREAVRAGVKYFASQPVKTPSRANRMYSHRRFREGTAEKTGRGGI